jgi:CheY-like chemotaxis protein
MPHPGSPHSLAAEPVAGAGWPAVAKASRANKSKSSKKAGPTQSGAGRLVMVVEDGELNAKLLGKILRRAGAEVEFAANGAIGVSGFRELVGDGRVPDLVLMDFNMPVMDGIEATAAIRAAETELGVTPAVPIIGITAGGQEDDKERALAVGMDSVRIKPFQTKDVMDVLEQLRKN